MDVVRHNRSLAALPGSKKEQMLGKSEFWASAADMESDLSFCEVEIELFDGLN